MASIPVTFQGVLTFADVGVGGGPMPGGLPPHIWGGTPGLPGGGVVGPPPYPGYPAPPGGGNIIWGGTPGLPGGGNVGPPPYPGYPAPPLGIWGGGNMPYPSQPIYYPPPEAPTEPPSEGGGRWGYVPGVGWVWVPAGGTDKPSPPSADVPHVEPR